MVLNWIMYISVLNVFFSFVVLKWGKVVYFCIFNVGYEFDIVVGIVLVKMYVKCGSYKDCC